VTRLDDLSGKEVFVNPLTVYPASLENLNKSLEGEGKKPVIIKLADNELGDEDLLEMVSAGLIPATVTINVRALFWAKVFDHLHLCSQCILSGEEQLGFRQKQLYHRHKTCQLTVAPPPGTPQSAQFPFWTDSLTLRQILHFCRYTFSSR
jgi:hypothetical protein